MEEDNWNTVGVQNAEQEKNKIEIEFEEPPEKEPEIKLQEKEETKVEIEQEDEPVNKKAEAPELEGIKTKGAEQRIRKLIRQRKERDEQIQALIQKNEELTYNLRTKDKEVNTLGKSSLEASEKQLQDKIELARTAYSNAFEEGDQEKVLQAQEMLNDAQIDLKSVTAAKSNYQEVEQAPVQQQVQPQPQPQPQRTDPKAEEWAANNDWFGQDNVMTAAALAIDAELKGEGYDPMDQDFYEEIDNRIKSAFPQKFEESQSRVQENTSKPAQVVSGGSRSSPTSSKKVKLTKEDVRLAQKWDIPLERYAAEKLKVDDSDGYTNIT